MAKIQPVSTGLSGEYFVAAELYRRGWLVGLTLGNAKSIDMFAEKANLFRRIQVKAIYQRKNVGWPINKERIQTNCFYIFVNLNADKMTKPDYYICSGADAKKRAKQYKTRGIVNLSTLENPKFKDNWGALDR